MQIRTACMPKKPDVPVKKTQHLGLKYVTLLCFQHDVLFLNAMNPFDSKRSFWLFEPVSLVYFFLFTMIMWWLFIFAAYLSQVKISKTFKKGSPMRHAFLLSLFLTCSCDLLWGPSPKNQEDSCILEKRMYPVQFAKRDNTLETYELTLLGTPVCFKNPLVLENVRLGRLDQSKTKEKVKIPLF